MPTRSFYSVTALVLFVLMPSKVIASNLVVAAGLEAQETSWKDDMAGAATLKLAYQWFPWSAYFLTELGVARVDERVLEHLELGAEYQVAIGSSFTFVRAGVTHRHEVPVEAIDNSTTTLLGFGDGIRHRGGLAAGAGVIFPLSTVKGGDLYAAVEANVDVLFGAAGPADYWGLGFALGYAYDLSGGK